MNSNIEHEDLCGICKKTMDPGNAGDGAIELKLPPSPKYPAESYFVGFVWRRPCSTTSNGSICKHCKLQFLSEYIQEQETIETPDYKRMFSAVIQSLAEISLELGIDGAKASVANGNALIIERIRKLQNQAKRK